MKTFDVLSAQINRWSASKKDQTLRGKTVFPYMDRAGEMYLAHDFEQLFVREYEKDTHPRPAVEIYQMASSKDALYQCSVKEMIADYTRTG